MKQMQQARLSTKVRSDMTRRDAARSSFRIIVYNIMHNELAISLQIEIADKSEDEIEQIASLSYLSLRGRRRNKRHGCFLVTRCHTKKYMTSMNIIVLFNSVDRGRF